jgi:hypothetical protein
MGFPVLKMELRCLHGEHHCFPGACQPADALRPGHSAHPAPLLSLVEQGDGGLDQLRLFALGSLILRS